MKNPAKANSIEKFPSIYSSYHPFIIHPLGLMISHFARLLGLELVTNFVKFKYKKRHIFQHLSSVESTTLALVREFLSFFCRVLLDLSTKIRNLLSTTNVFLCSRCRFKMVTVIMQTLNFFSSIEELSFILPMVSDPIFL